MIDLHIHSTASDGSCTPAEILELVSKAGITAFSLTDHDTIDGAKEILARKTPNSPEFLTGVEISCNWPEGRNREDSLHILGYGFDVHNRNLNNTLEKLKKARYERNPQIIQKLNDLGYDISMDEVEKLSSDGQTGRPHVARVMVEKGIVDSFDLAFDKFLARGCPAYVDKYRIRCEEAVSLIHEAGGIAVLAHPGLIGPENEQLAEKLIKDLALTGLDGVEVYYPEHSEKQTENLEGIAERLDLLATGGTDFHGSFKKGIRIGTGYGTLNVRDFLLDRLKCRLELVRGMEKPVANLEHSMGYSFTKRSRLFTALCHSSFVNEKPGLNLSDNEKYEFIGDAVLGLAVGHLLMEQAEDKNEGELSKLRATLVSEPYLAGMARRISLDKHVLLGKGERLSGGSQKDSILADTFEAVIAAVYFDSDYRTAHQLISDLFREQIRSFAENTRLEDYKSRLQELIQENGDNTPLYRIQNESGPDHDKTFRVMLKVRGITATGTGKNKKTAEQAAAKQALSILKNTD
ncbi:MAG: ribonuclease III [Desulfobacteraceae bacterium]